MRRTPFLFLAAVSLLLSCGHAAAATRPLYGGTLRIETRARIASLDPARLPADPGGLSLAEKLFFLVGDRLVRIDRRGRVRPSLATGWHASAGDRRWTFDLRPGVKFQDGKPLVARDVVAALVARHPHWSLRAADMQVSIRLPRPAPHLLLALALAENSILRMGQDGIVIGTGPFRVARFTPGRISLAANDGDWRGRPFLDGVEILMGRATREQWIDLELGRADVVEIPPDRVHRTRQSHVRVWSSEPDELVALVFDRSRPAAQDAAARQALANGVNRAALRDVLLQKQGTVARSILPAWLSGYAFLFAPPPTPASASAAGPAPAAAPALPSLTLAYDSSDPLLASFAARIAVDARAVGIRLQLEPQAPGAKAPADVRLVRQPIESLDPASALRRMVSALGLGDTVTVPGDANPEALYTTEQSIVSSHWVIPLVDVPELYGVSSSVMDWMPPEVTPAGGWRLAEVWKEPE
jgi:peptide/nickel transport system substrate-binding protein